MQRFTPNHYGGMEPDPDGEWVRYTDTLHESEDEQPTPDPTE